MATTTHVEAPQVRRPAATIRVAIADDQELVRRGLCFLLADEDDIEIVGEAGDGDAAIEMAQTMRPDVVLMDVCMPGRDGIDATRRIVSDPDLEGVHVLVFTSFETDEYLFDALRAGASGFLLKDADRRQVVEAVRVVAAGDSLLAPGPARRLVEEFTRWPERRLAVPSLLSDLTAREQEVLTLVAYGLTNEQIARRLVVSPATAKTHVSRTMLKLGARDRAQLVVLAYQSGLVSIGPRVAEAA